MDRPTQPEHEGKTLREGVPCKREIAEKNYAEEMTMHEDASLACLALLSLNSFQSLSVGLFVDRFTKINENQ